MPDNAAPVAETLDPQTLQVLKALSEDSEAKNWDRVGVGFVERTLGSDEAAAQAVFAKLKETGVLGEQVDNGRYGSANLINREELQKVIAQQETLATPVAPAPAAAETPREEGLPSALASIPADRREALAQAPLFANPDGLVQIDGAKPVVAEPAQPVASAPLFANPDALVQIDGVQPPKRSEEPVAVVTEDDRYQATVKRLQESWYDNGKGTVTTEQMVSFNMAADADEAKRFAERLQKDGIIGAPNANGEHSILEPKKAEAAVEPVAAAPVADGQDPLYASAVKAVDGIHAKAAADGKPAQVSPMTLLQELRNQPDLPVPADSLKVEDAKNLLDTMEKKGVVGPSDGNIGWRDIVAPEKRPVPAAEPAAAAPAESEEDKRYKAAAAFVDDQFTNNKALAVSPETLVKGGVAADETEAKKMLARMVDNGIVQDADALGYHPVIDPAKRKNPPSLEEENTFGPLDPVEAERLRQQRARQRQDQLPVEEEVDANGTRRTGAAGAPRPDPSANNGASAPVFNQTNGHFHPEDYKKIMEFFSHKDGHVLDHTHDDNKLVIHTATGKVTVTQEKLTMHGGDHDHDTYRAATLSAGHLWNGGKANGNKDHQITAVAYGQAYGVNIVATKKMNDSDRAEIARIRREIEHDNADDPLLKINKDRQAGAPVPQDPRDRTGGQPVENSIDRLQPTPV